MEHRITAIKVQNRNPNRVSVSLDGEYAFGLSRVVAAWLHIGMVISDDRIAQLRAQDAQEVAFQKALSLISRRPRAEGEIRRKLETSGFDEAAIEATLARLRQSGLAGDRQFAQLWVENRSEFRPRGRRMLAFELRQKGVQEEIIQDALNDAGDEFELAMHAAQKYARRLSGLDRDAFWKRLISFLARRGFGYATSKEVAERVWQLQDCSGAGEITLENEEL
jgi:regulatory protein